MNEEKSKPKELKRQLWEPAGVVSIRKQPGMDYDLKSPENRKGGQINLEVEEVFDNKGMMENLPENTPKSKRDH